MSDEEIAGKYCAKCGRYFSVVRDMIDPDQIALFVGSERMGLYLLHSEDDYEDEVAEAIERFGAAHRAHCPGERRR